MPGSLLDAGRALLLAAAAGLVLPVSAFADGSPGSSGDAGDSSVSGSLIAVGAGALIAGFLLWDALSGDGEAAVEPAAVEQDPAGSTGIDWSSVAPVDGGSDDLITVSAAGVGLSGAAAALVRELDSLSGYPVYGEPVELGGASGDEAFSLAASFFDAGWLVLVTPEADSMRVEVYGPGGLEGSFGGDPADAGSAAEGVVGVLAGCSD
ncbi:MAG: hypothetical protein QUS11_04500 [Candidatus Fermentibacter sp.]|nr:hypothetical protein [Candidatus Fermentibacter sp.]